MSGFTVTSEDLQVQIQALERLSARTIDPCTVSTFLAISDPEVQAILIRKFAEGNVFGGVCCLPGIGIPEVQQVLFKFNCPPGIFCLIAPSFLVSVNFIEGRVVGIQDPYIPTLAFDNQSDSAT